MALFKERFELDSVVLDYFSDPVVTDVYASSAVRHQSNELSTQGFFMIDARAVRSSGFGNTLICVTNGVTESELLLAS